MLSFLSWEKDFAIKRPNTEDNVRVHVAVDSDIGGLGAYDYISGDTNNLTS